MSDDFEIAVDTSQPRAIVVRVRGRVDGRTASRLLERALDARVPGRAIVLNLGEVTFLSSAGVGMIMVLSETLGRDSAALRLAPVSSAVSSVLGLLNLDQFLSIHESEADALDKLAS